jgi:large subunit ribosomal protein L13
VRTFSPKPDDLTRTWYLVDADGLVLGRMATEVARVLRGKHKPTFAPHVDTGDHVVVVNAGKVIMTAGKADDRIAYRHSGYPGGLKSESYKNLLDKHPEDLVRKVVAGMLPHTRLGRSQISKLKVYRGPTHPHQAQAPVPLEIAGARARS